MEDNNGNKFYSSIAIYKDSDGVTNTKLYNLAASDPLVPLFRENISDYFVAVENGEELAELIARGQESSIYSTELRVRTVGGEYLLDADEVAKALKGTDAGAIPLHDGTNRVTITAKTSYKDPGSERMVTHKRAYEVELYRAYTTDQ